MLEQGTVEVDGQTNYYARYIDWAVTTPLLMRERGSAREFKREIGALEVGRRLARTAARKLGEWCGPERPPEERLGSSSVGGLIKKQPPRPRGPAPP
ncbi:bacteriorhodopsin [Deinococcus marmoris]|uniref:bacteriorhodopsin n=1 Tax=Deinococcus marmoris TaxID=249408 RepID=UPI003CCBF27B